MSERSVWRPRRSTDGMQKSSLVFKDMSTSNEEIPFLGVFSVSGRSVLQPLICTSELFNTDLVSRPSAVDLCGLPLLSRAGFCHMRKESGVLVPSPRTPPCNDFVNALIPPERRAMPSNHLGISPMRQLDGGGGGGSFAVSWLAFWLSCLSLCAYKSRKHIRQPNIPSWFRCALLPLQSLYSFGLHPSRSSCSRANRSSASRTSSSSLSRALSTLLCR